MSKISVKVVASRRKPEVFGSSGDIIFEISVHEPSLIGRSAKLTITRHVKVKETKPVNKDDKIEKKFILRHDKIEIPVSSKQLPLFSYEGDKLDISVNVTLKVDTGLLFNKKIDINARMGTLPRTRVPVDDAQAVIEPEDKFSFLKNLIAIPVDARMIIVFLGILGAVFLFVNTLIGVHDENVPRGMTWVYAKGSGRDSPLYKAMQWNFVAAAVVLGAVLEQLKRYMSFHLTSKPSMFKPGTKFQVKDLISGIPIVPLESAELRIVACNFEKGSHIIGSGRDSKEVHFSRPIRAITLYKKKVFKLPAGRNINIHFPELISFDDIYKKLYPAQMLTDTHGIDLYWEVQLLHDAYVDQELEGPVEPLRYQYFLLANKNTDEQDLIDLHPEDKKDVA